MIHIPMTIQAPELTPTRAHDDDARWCAGKNISRSQLIELLNDGYLHEDSDAHVSLTDKGTNLLSTNS